ncbi:hypothetical protein [Streptacidiphilus monticola]|uniref:SseB protein N-terminal domain-containing protein n=1 Tax=Streptacidiphilus monticola TaxID=2161674 RepID=A0ABW1G598_9ACTN
MAREVESTHHPRARTLARVARVRADRAWVVLPAWRAGAILVLAPVGELEKLLGRHGRDLLGAELTVEVNLGALLDSELRPAHWATAEPAPTTPPAPADLPALVGV